MATDVIMPALGVAQQTGTLLKWLKTEGESVSKGEPLMEVETDKATVEIEAAASGILAGVTAKPGDEVPVGQRIALILAPDEVASAAALQDPHPRSFDTLRTGSLPKGEGISQSRPLSQGNGAVGLALSLREREGVRVPRQLLTSWEPNLRPNQVRLADAFSLHRRQND